MTKSVGKAIVPAAGLGTRMRPLTHACPKELLPVGGLPVIHRLMEELIDAGITEVCVVTHREKPSLRVYFERVDLPLSLVFVEQKETRGLGDAVRYGREFADGDPVVVALGDCLIESTEEASPLRRMIRLHQATGGGVILGETVPIENVSRYGVMAPAKESLPSVAEPPAARAGSPPAAESAGSPHGGVNPRDMESGSAVPESFLVGRLVEKPSPGKSPGNIVVCARYLLPFAIFDALDRAPSDGARELGLTEGIELLLARRNSIYGLVLRNGEHRRDIGGLSTYFDAFAAYAARDRLERGEEIA